MANSDFVLAAAEGDFAMAPSASPKMLVSLVAATRCAVKFVPVGCPGAAATPNGVLTGEYDLVEVSYM